MCGGISSALSLQTPTGKGFYARLMTTTSVYNFGRLTSYSLMGAIVGYVGVTAADTWASLQVTLRTLASLMLILAGIYLTGLWNGLQPLERLGALLWRKLSPLNQRIQILQGSKRDFFLGLLWGWIPCGLVYSALTFAAVQQNVLQSSFSMLCFGLGTLPAMLTTGLLYRSVHSIKSSRGVHICSGLLLIAFGLWSFPGLFHYLFHVYHTAS